MPFMASGGGGTGPAPAAGPVTMQIEPGQILALKARYEAVRDTLQDFLDTNRRSLRATPLADDEVSDDAASVFSENAETAIEVTERFLDELNLNIDALDQANKTYNLAEGVNETAMRQQHRGI